MSGLRHVFVTPPLDGPPTGGTIYDAELIRALARAGVSAQLLDLDSAHQALLRHEREPGDEAFWVDSLYLEALPTLARRAGPGQHVGLIAHYLPSLVAFGVAFTPAHLTSVERAALETAAALVVPSSWLRDVMTSLGVSHGRIRVVEPGIHDAAVAEPRPVTNDAPVAALIVANVVPGKGIASFLEALAVHLSSAPSSIVVVIIGSLEADADYAARCRAIVRAGPSLEGVVHFLPALPHSEVMRAMQESDVLVSASRMESYGMALAEGRSLGLPILARRGGNASAHVDPAAGGELFDDDASLAAALVRLSRDRSEFTRRRTLARSHLKHRSWDAAARDFLDSSPFRP